MQRLGVPQTYENYLKIKFGEPQPELDAELAASLPEQFRKQA